MALYRVSRAWRKFGPFESMATASMWGRRSPTTFCSMFTVPSTAWVGSPRVLERGGSAW